MEANTKARSRFFWPIILLITGAFVGLILGLGIGLHSVESIIQHAEQTSGEIQCGTGLPIILFGFPALGTVLGAIPGLTAVILLSLRNQSKAKSDWAVYWGK